MTFPIENTATIDTDEYSIGGAAEVSTLPGGVPLSLTDPGDVSLVIDRSAMAAGDEFLIQVYEKAVSGGTQRVCQRYTITATGAIDVFGPIPLRNGYDWTIKKISGTDRSMSMSIRRANVTAPDAATATALGSVATSATGAHIQASTAATQATTAASNTSTLLSAVAALPSAATIASTLLGAAVEGSRTLAQTLRGLWSFGLTKASGFDTGTVVLRDAGDTKDRITIGTASTGRTSVTVGDLD